MCKKILTNEERKRLVDAYGRMGKARIIAQAYNVSERTVFRLVAQKNNTGNVELQTSKRGRKPKITESDLQRITETIIAEPDITLQEIIDKLHLNFSVPSLCKIIRHKLGFTRKKKVYTLLNAINPKCKQSEPNGRNLCRSSTPTSSSS